jgi:hypothetical protein
MKIFVSHADADRVLATKFVEFLQLGAGLSHRNIFYSSAKGMIRNGESFVETIIAALNQADLVIALLSPSYLTSHFCLAEAGAALAKKKAGASDFFSFVIPPATFADLDGMLLGTQSGSILDLPIHGHLKDRIQTDIARDHVPGSDTWDEKRQDFPTVAADAVSQYEAQQDLNNIILDDYKWCWEEGNETQKVWAHAKLRFRFKNAARKPLDIESGTWDSGNHGVPLLVTPPNWQLKWHPRLGAPEVESLQVAPGSSFNTWIPLAETVKADECLRRSAAKRTGRMELKLRIGNHSLTHLMMF